MKENRKRGLDEERPQQVEVVPAVDDVLSIIREVMAANPVVTPVIAPQAPPTVAERLSILNAEIELAKIRHSNPMLLCIKSVSSMIGLVFTTWCQKRFYRTRRVRYRSGDLGEDRTTQWCDLTDFTQKCCMPESLSLQ